MVRFERIAMLLVALVVQGCWAFVPVVPEGRSVEYTNSGHLRGASRLEDRGPGYRRARPGEATAFGTPAMVGLVERSAALVAREYPGTIPLVVGDLSYERGGAHPRHGSHRSGRDVDVIFYAVDAEGRPVPGRGWTAYDRSGAPLRGRDTGASVFFDDARNWRFVQALVMDESAPVQWIFVSRGLKARLLRHAIAVGAPAEAIARASLVLQQPQSSSPHDDHFHVRIYCDPAEGSLGCRDRAPHWPWHRRTLRESRGANEHLTHAAELTDGVLLGELLGDEPVAQHGVEQQL